VLLEDATDDFESSISDGHLERVHIASTFCTFGESALLVTRLEDFREGQS
jgi:hypothetical protein